MDIQVVKNGREFVAIDREGISFSYSPECLADVRIKADKGLFPYQLTGKESDEELVAFLGWVDSGNYQNYLRDCESGMPYWQTSDFLIGR